MNNIIVAKHNGVGISMVAIDLEPIHTTSVDGQYNGRIVVECEAMYDQITKVQDDASVLVEQFSVELDNFLAAFTRKAIAAGVSQDAVGVFTTNVPTILDEFADSTAHLAGEVSDAIEEKFQATTLRQLQVEGKARRIPRGTRYGTGIDRGYSQEYKNAIKQEQEGSLSFNDPDFSKFIRSVMAAQQPRDVAKKSLVADTVEIKDYLRDAGLADHRDSEALFNQGETAFKEYLQNGKGEPSPEVQAHLDRCTIK